MTVEARSAGRGPGLLSSVLNHHEHRSAARPAVLLAVLVLAAGSVRAQAPARKVDSVLGEVTSADPAARRFVLKTDAGAAVEVRLQDGATFLRAKPGASTLADATPVAPEDVAVGDRVLARGAMSEDKSSIVARQLVVMTRGDIADKQEQERADWRRRSVLGVVSAVDAARAEVTLRLGRMAGGTTLVVATAERPAVFRRYPPDSVKFADARPSTLAEVQPGDQLRALGERSPDGARLVAEQVVFGTFRTVVGTVTAVDAAKQEVTLRDAEGRRPLVVSVGPDARVRRLLPEMAARLLRFSEAAGDGERSSRGPDSERPARGPEPERPPRGPDPERPTGPSSRSGDLSSRSGDAEQERPARGGGGWSRGSGGPGGGRGGGPEDLIDRLAPTTLAEIKTGDLVLVCSAKGADPARANAIALVSGLEALQPAARPGRGGRGAEVGLPSDLMDLGLGIQ